MLALLEIFVSKDIRFQEVFSEIFFFLGMNLLNKSGPNMVQTQTKPNQAEPDVPLNWGRLLFFIELYLGQPLHSSKPKSFLTFQSPQMQFPTILQWLYIRCSLTWSPPHPFISFINAFSSSVECLSSWR